VKRYTRKFTPEAARLLAKIPPVAKPFLRALADEILLEPYQGRALRYDLEGYYSVRHSRYRIIYSIDENGGIVVIEYVGLRRDVYRLFSNLIRTVKRLQ